MTSTSTNSMASLFGSSFQWGVAISAAQNEGAWNAGGRGPSTWDAFARRQGKIKAQATPAVCCDFYHRYKDDLLLAKALGFKVFRFSVSWSRIFPDGTGAVNKAGIAFYHQVIDECLQLQLVPYITLYHWDLPQALEKEGGWGNYRILSWFSRYVARCAQEYGGKVKHWIVLNEPMGFTSLGYLLGKHAPGKRDYGQFLSAVHHAALAQAEGGRILRTHVQGAKIGTSFSCSEVLPFSDRKTDADAAGRLDILLNRLFVEPALGMGYPNADFPLLNQLVLHNKAWKDTSKMQFDFDFIGLQNYFSLTVKHNPYVPLINAIEVKAKTRKQPATALGWEIDPESFYRMVKRFWAYEGVRELIITEGGACFKDHYANGAVHDAERINYFKAYLQALLRAKQEGVHVTGYFAWTLMDNFEWNEGFNARFGLIYVDFKSQLRTIKDSGYWWRDFLSIK